MPTNTFTDASGKKWEARLDFATVARIKRAVGLKLDDFSKLGPTLAELVVDDAKAIDAVWLAIEHAADGKSKDDWLAAMTGELLEKARDALFAAFKAHVGAKRAKVVDTALAKIRSNYDRAIADCVRTIEEIDTDQPPAEVAKRSRLNRKG